MASAPDLGRPSDPVFADDCPFDGPWLSMRSRHRAAIGALEFACQRGCILGSCRDQGASHRSDLRSSTSCRWLSPTVPAAGNVSPRGRAIGAGLFYDSRRYSSHAGAGSEGGGYRVRVAPSSVRPAALSSFRNTSGATVHRNAGHERFLIRRDILSDQHLHDGRYLRCPRGVAGGRSERGRSPRLPRLRRQVRPPRPDRGSEGHTTDSHGGNKQVTGRHEQFRRWHE